jgi:hypothetical protein
MADLFYKLRNCITDEVVYTNDSLCTSCEYYVGNLLHTQLDPIPCWFVIEYDPYINPPVSYSTVVGTEGYCFSCLPTCYTITGTGTVSYANSNSGTLTEYETDLPAKICSEVYPIVNGVNYQVFTGAPCDRGECVYTWYTLTNCDTGYVINSDNQDLAFPFALDQIVKLEEFDGCWTITEGIGDPPPFLNATPIQTFTSCYDCNPPTYYRLESCGESESITIYTEQDLSAYNGKTVKLEEYPGCFNVTVFTSTFPSPVTVTVVSDYVDCPACEAVRYKLTDCDGVRNSIYTTTDLSAYLTSVIKLTFYPDTCWTVEETLISTFDDLVIVGNEYTTCEECSADALCLCSTITNNGNTSEVFSYRDCEGVVNSITLSSGETSDKYCVLKWIYPAYWTLPKVITSFGECVDGECVEIKPVRSIRPGYNTPSCSIQYYEKITCEFSEILYKNVISERYGIAPCCPEEEITKLDIKYQLLEMQAINNPDYVCTTTSCGCQQTVSCGCGCNS